MHNLWDRIALRYVLNPLGEDEVRDLVDFRLRQAGYKGAAPLFTNEAIRLVWEQTRGYPRKLTLCCHNALERLVMEERRVVDEDVVRRVIDADLQVPGVPAEFAGVPTVAEQAELKEGRAHAEVDLPRLRVRYGA
jgi:hypothetical protein